MTSVLILAGAGLSVSAGIPAFRGPGGEWTTREDVRRGLDLLRFNSKPKLRMLVWRWLADSPAWGASPTAAHRALARLDGAGKLNGVYTQNFDGLEDAAGIDPDRIHRLHGSMAVSRCQRCGARLDTRTVIADLGSEPDPHCHEWNAKKGRECGGVIKPGIVFFGENLDRRMVDRMGTDMMWSDELWCLGTSLNVHPAADVVDMARAAGRPVTIVSLGPTAMDGKATRVIRATTDDAVPALVDGLIARDAGR